MIIIDKISFDQCSGFNGIERRKDLRRRQKATGMAMVNTINKVKSYEYVSKAHKNEYVAVIAGDFKVGIDIENVLLKPQNLNCLCKIERDLCNSYYSGLVWALKEAISKITNLGLKRINDVIVCKICDNKVYAKINDGQKNNPYISCKFYWCLIKDRYVMTVVRF